MAVAGKQDVKGRTYAVAFEGGVAGADYTTEEPCSDITEENAVCLAQSYAPAGQ